MQYKTIKHVLPEFKESENETIRKDILAFIKNNAVGEHNWHKWLAWLEKQGEQENKINFTFEDVLVEHLPCLFVHQLQHALRLCGITREIIL